MSQASRHRHLVGMIAAALILGIGACAPAPVSITTAPPPSPAPTIAPTPTSIPAPTSVPTATNTPFVPKATVKIVSQGPGYTDIAEGARLAIDQLSVPLRDLGFAVAYNAYDDQDNVDVAVENAKQFVDDAAVLCGVGHYTSRVTINLEDLYHREGLAFISPSATNPDVTQPHYVEINRVTGRDDVTGVAAARFMQSEGWQSVLIVRNPVDYAGRVTDGFKREVGSLGMALLGDLSANPDATGFDSVLSRTMEQQPDVLYFGGWPEQAGRFFKEARLAGYTGVLFTLYGAPALGEDAGPLALEDGGLYYMTGSIPPLTHVGTQKFADDFAAANGRPPQLTGFGVEAYDAAGVCLRAIEEASREKDGELPTRQEVAEAIRRIEGFSGISGAFRFNADGEAVPAQYVVLKAVSVDPSSWDRNPVAASIELPPPE